MKAVITLFVFLIIFFLLEKAYVNSLLKRIPIRILVNGTRGKTSVVRLIISSLNENGKRASAKTTGSSAEIILPDGKVEKIIRKKGPRLEENIKFLKRAIEEGSECIVVECMALRDENQRALSSYFIRPNYTIIVNSLKDHAAEMGEYREDVVHALSSSIIKGTKLYVTEPYYDNEKADIHRVDVKHYDIDAMIPIHDEDVSVALALLKDIGIKEEDSIKAFKNAIPDSGLNRDIKMGESIFVPSFAINDEESMENEIKRVRKEYKEKVILIFNNRADREYRIKYIAEAINALRNDIHSVIVIGDYKTKTARFLERKCNIEAIVMKNEEIIDRMKNDNRVYLALGNIKGDGEDLINVVKGDEKCFIQQ